jgi:DNA polymerase V
MKKLTNRIQITEIIQYKKGKKITLPLYSSRVPAGFPSPADDFLDKRLDLNEYLIKHPAATFFVRVTGNSMIHAGIHSGDILIVDRAEEPKDKSVVVALLDGEFTVKRIRKIKKDLFLVPENGAFKPMKITEDMDFEVWGVVQYVIHELKK